MKPHAALADSGLHVGMGRGELSSNLTELGRFDGSRSADYSSVPVAPGAGLPGRHDGGGLREEARQQLRRLRAIVAAKARCLELPRHPLGALRRVSCRFY